MSPSDQAQILLVAFALAAGVVVSGAPQAADKLEPVAVVGCLKEMKPGTWILVDASDPVASTANAPSAKELDALPRSGTNRFQLIGVAVFDLPAHRDHSVVLKGLLIKDPPPSRLNVTSVTMVAATCPPRVN
jgi:hypothetical protein